MENSENKRLRHGQIRKTEKLKQFLPELNRGCSPRNSDIGRHISGSPLRNTPSKRSPSSDRSPFPELRNSGSNTRHSTVSKIETGKASERPCGVAKAYAVNSFSNRHHNEDRVSIIINLPKPPTVLDEIWPHSSFFGLFDGHGGKKCSEFLKSNLYTQIVQHPHFPIKIKEAVLSSFQRTDEDFLQKCKESGELAGSCAIIVILIGDKCVVANTGDSRALVSLNQGKSMIWLSQQHRPGDTHEYTRIHKAGGEVYNNYILNNKGENINLGPHLVSPGKLKVSRSFGDLDAKDPTFGGIPNVIICTPDIKSFKVKADQDFILLASAGVFDKLEGREIVDIVFRNAANGENLGSCLLNAIEEIILETCRRMCDDNITVIIIALKGIKEYMCELNSKCKN